MGKCKYNKAWIGNCKNTATHGDYCDDHYNIKCVSCGEQATRECPETGQFVCGAPLCDNCEHTTFEDGTNGGIGFNSQKLPEGMKLHIKKNRSEI